MFSLRWFFALIGLGLITMGVWFGSFARSKINEAVRQNARISAEFRPIADAAIQTARASQDQYGNIRPFAFIHPSATALIWDEPGNKISPMYYDLPPPCQARATDPEITVFLIEEMRSKQVGEYVGLMRDQVAYQDTVRVVAVKWPELTIVAVREITGDMPPETIAARNYILVRSTHGDSSGNVVRWILSLQPQFLERAAARQVNSSYPPHRWTEAEARAEAVRRYPQLGIANSPMNKAFIERYNQLKLEASDYLQSPDWPLRLAAEVAR
jgi:hypothetical protein